MIFSPILGKHGDRNLVNILYKKSDKSNTFLVTNYFAL